MVYDAHDRETSVNRAETAATLEIGMLHRDGGSTSGIVGELAYSGVRLKFSNDADIVLPIGDTVSLLVRSNVLDDPIAISTIATARFDKSNCREYGFKFHDPEALHFQLPQALQNQFNQRKVARVYPAPDAPVGIWLTNVEGDAVPGQVVDMSRSGAGVRVSRDLEIGFSQLTRVDMTLRLPETPDACNVQCRIRNRSLLDDMIHYGLEFCVNELSASPDTRQTIVDYVTRRQSDISQAQQGFSRIFT